MMTATAPPRLDPYAAGLCATWARYAPAIAATAAGEGLTRSTLAGCAELIAGALEVFERAPLTDYWRGYFGSVADAARGMLDIADAARVGALATGLEPGGDVSDVAALDPQASARGAVLAAALGVLHDADAGGMLQTSPGAAASPAFAAMLDVLQTRAADGDALAAGLAEHLGSVQP